MSRPTTQSSLSRMRLFVCRHGERMDVVFGKQWVTQCFDSKGKQAGETVSFSFSFSCRLSADTFDFHISFLCKILICVCAGRYIRSNLNMPSNLPARSGGHRDYDKDCPITVFGSTQARLVGQWLEITKEFIKYSMDCATQIAS